MLSLCPADLETWAVLLAPVVLGGLLFSAPLLSNRGERSPRRRPWAVAIVVTAVLMIGSLWVVGAQSHWSPNFNEPPLSVDVVGAASGPVAEGARLFHDKACLSCHLIDGHGGRRGPNLSRIGDLLTHDDIVVRISNGGRNMPGFASTLAPAELEELAQFLMSRRAPAAR